MTFPDQLDLIQNQDESLGLKLRELGNLEAILRWIPREGLPLSSFDSIQQDEYNYDVVFPWKDHRWIVFGVT
ncbi:MAG: hypothetical protein U0798_08060 [Gemmataceae bacterium]